MQNTSHNPAFFTLALVLLSFAIAPKAQAMIVLAVDLPDLILESQAIVQGVVMHLDNVVLDKNGETLTREEVAKIQQTPKRSDLSVFTDISILVGRRFLGNTPPGQILKLRMVGGRIGAFTLAVPGMPRFRPRDEVVLFLEKTPVGLVPLGAAQGVFRVERADETPPTVRHDLHGIAMLRPAALPDHCGGEVSDTRGCSGVMASGFPAIPDQMPLATLHDHIHAVLGIAPTPQNHRTQGTRQLQRR
jgi:hypothetical protein